MKELGPAEFPRLPGYRSRGCAATTSAACWYLLVSIRSLATAVIRKTRSLTRAVSRRAGIGLAGIERFLAAPTAAVVDRWRADLAAETGRGDVLRSVVLL
jgi:hypothetical protein